MVDEWRVNLTYGGVLINAAVPTPTRIYNSDLRPLHDIGLAQFSTSSMAARGRLHVRNPWKASFL